MISDGTCIVQRYRGAHFLRETKGFPAIWRVTAAYQLTPY